MGIPSTAAFSDAVSHAWTLPVKNTFISFDLPPLAPSARIRAETCPPAAQSSRCGMASWEEATQELCHAMAPKHHREPAGDCILSASAGAAQSGAKSGASCSPEALPHGGRPGHEQQQLVQQLQLQGQRRRRQHQQQDTTKARAQPHQDRAEEDTISELSTTSSEGTSEMPLKEPVVQRWTGVTWRKKARAPAEALKPTATAKPQSYHSSHRDEGSYGQHYGGYGGKGKGLSHFQRIEVGIEDDHDFRVVQRLIGSRGKHMQDIVSRSKGAKVWIIGRGSRSWEDDSGPLTVCVGATSSSTFDTAVRLVQELLRRVSEDYKKFHR